MGRALTLKTMEMPARINFKTIVVVSADSPTALAVGVSFGADFRLVCLDRLARTFHPGSEVCDLLVRQ